MAPKRTSRTTSSTKRTTRRTTRATSTQPDASPLAEGLPPNPRRRRTRAASSQPDGSPLAQGLPDPPRRRGRNAKAKPPSPTPEPVVEDVGEADDAQSTAPSTGEEEELRPSSSGSGDVILESTERDHNYMEPEKHDEDALSIEGGAEPSSVIGDLEEESFEREDVSVQEEMQETQGTQETAITQMTVVSEESAGEDTPTQNSEETSFLEYPTMEAAIMSTPYPRKAATPPISTPLREAAPSPSQQPPPPTELPSASQDVMATAAPERALTCGKLHASDPVPESELDIIAVQLNNSIALPLGINFIEVIKNLMEANRHLESQRLALSEFILTQGIDPEDVIVEHAARIDGRESVESGGLEEEYQWERVQRGFDSQKKKEEYRKRRLFDRLREKGEREKQSEDHSNDWFWEGKPRPRQGVWDFPSSVSSPGAMQATRSILLNHQEKSSKKMVDSTTMTTPKGTKKGRAGNDSTAKSSASTVRRGSPSKPSVQMNGISEMDVEDASTEPQETPKAQNIEQNGTIIPDGVQSQPEKGVSSPQPAAQPNINDTSANDVAMQSDSALGDDQEDIVAGPVLTALEAAAQKAQNEIAVITTPNRPDHVMSDDSDDDGGGWGIKSLMTSGRKIFASVGKYIPGYTPAKRQRVTVDEAGSPSKPNQAVPATQPRPTPVRARKGMTIGSVRRRQTRTRTAAQTEATQAEATQANERVQFEDEFDSHNSTPSVESVTPQGSFSKRKRDTGGSMLLDQGPVIEAPWTTGRRSIQASPRRRFRRSMPGTFDSSPVEESVSGKIEAFFGYEGNNYEDWLRAAGHNRRMWPEGPPDLRDPNEYLPKFPSLPWTTDYVELKAYLPSPTLSDNFTYMIDLKYERRKFRCNMVQVIGHPRESRLRFFVGFLRRTDVMDYALIMQWFSPVEENWRQWLPGFTNFAQFNPQGLLRLQFQYYPAIVPDGYKPSSPGRTFSLEYSDDEDDEDIAMDTVDASEEDAAAPSASVASMTATVEDVADGSSGRWTQAPPAAPVPAHATLPKAAPSTQSQSRPNIFSSSPINATSSPASSSTTAASSLNSSAPPSNQAAAAQRARVDKHKPAVPSKLSQELGRAGSESDGDKVVQSNPRPPMATLNQPVATPTSKASALPQPQPGLAPLNQPIAPASKELEDALSPTTPAPATPLSPTNVEASVKKTSEKQDFAQAGQGPYFSGVANSAFAHGMLDEASGFPDFAEDDGTDPEVVQYVKKLMQSDANVKDAQVHYFGTSQADTPSGQISAASSKK